MPNNNADPHPAANDPVTPGYRPGNRVDPLPRQWQKRTRQPAPAKPFVHKALHSAAGSAWQPTSARRTEFAALLGLWLLVVLAAVAIALRFLDLSSAPVGLAHPERGAASAEPAAQAPRLAPYLPLSAVVSDDPFDEPLPTSTPIAATATPAAPVQPRVEATELAPSVPMLERAPPATGETLGAPPPLQAALPDAPARPSAAAMPPGACPEALRAMQLCAGQR